MITALRVGIYQSVGARLLPALVRRFREQVGLLLSHLGLDWTDGFERASINLATRSARLAGRAGAQRGS